VTTNRAGEENMRNAYVAGAAHAHAVDALRTVADNAHEENRDQFAFGAGALAAPVAGGLLRYAGYRNVGAIAAGAGVALAIGSYFKLADANRNQTRILDSFPGVDAEPINTARRINDDATNTTNLATFGGLALLGLSFIPNKAVRIGTNLALVAGEGYIIKKSFENQPGLTAADCAMAKINAQERANGLDYAAFRAAPEV
jgi:hypothetical protein